ncbi:MAG: low molecular weight phosphotyrosine protein phosphatase [Bacilli bacterium]|nr:low molecular weight phosphotyrosine protein phosphatase [Bacilli bacterium]
MEKVYFVCHGNICRSVAAEMVFLALLEKRGLSKDYVCDSFATSYEEIGNPIYPPMKRELLSRGYALRPHYAKRIGKEEIEEADYVFYMDEENMYGLSRIYPNARTNPKIKPISFHTSKVSEIEDPWYTGRYGKVVDQIEVCLNAFLDAKH